MRLLRGHGERRPNAPTASQYPQPRTAVQPYVARRRARAAGPLPSSGCVRRLDRGLRRLCRTLGCSAGEEAVRAASPELGGVEIVDDRQRHHGAVELPEGLGLRVIDHAEPLRLVDLTGHVLALDATRAARVEDLSLDRLHALGELERFLHEPERIRRL